MNNSMHNSTDDLPEFDFQIVFLDGINKGEVAHFSSGIISFGRSPDCSVMLHRASLTVSRVHTKVIFKDNHFYLENASANGSFVNGIRQQNVKLTSGDVIGFSESGPKVRAIYKLFEGPTEAGDQPRISLQYEGNNQSFRQDYVILGSSPECDFEIVHPLISPQHAVLFYSDGDLYIAHANDSNRIIINSHEIHNKTKLNTNDRIELNIDGPRFKYLGSGKIIHQHDHPDTSLSPRGNEEMRTYIIPSRRTSMFDSFKSSKNPKKKN
ncbi:MAG: FHA domain-containing protein [Thiohalomonadales bacterium]